MHQCSNDADERLDTLRHHFNERIRVAGPRYGLLSCWWSIFLNSWWFTTVYRPKRGGKDPLTPKEMERRYNDKERAWRDTFSRLRLHLGVGVGFMRRQAEDDMSFATFPVVIYSFVWHSPRWVHLSWRIVLKLIQVVVWSPQKRRNHPTRREFPRSWDPETGPHETRRRSWRINFGPQKFQKHDLTGVFICSFQLGASWISWFWRKKCQMQRMSLPWRLDLAHVGMAKNGQDISSWWHVMPGGFMANLIVVKSRDAYMIFWRRRKVPETWQHQ